MNIGGNVEDARQWLEQTESVDDLVVFLDFDGTLAPIVDRPAQARPVEGVVAIIEELATLVPVAIISGRGLDDVRRRLGAEGIYYAGSHGMEIRHPDGRRHDDPELTRMLPGLDRHEEWLRRIFAEVEGVEIERKRFGIAVHYRRNPEARSKVEQRVAEVVRRNPGLKVGQGKMVREVQPNVELDKGTALRFIRDQIDPDTSRRPLYIGDDKTDEDAFAALEDDGISILVGQATWETGADYRLSDPMEVRQFLRDLVEELTS